MKLNSTIPPDRAYIAQRSSINPLGGLTPSLITSYLDAFRRGWLQMAAIAWDLIERRDDIVSVVAARRKKTVARHGWEIVMTNDSAEANDQRQALEQFYANISTTSALDQHEEGGLSLLIRQMMDAVGKKYSVHEIIWQPTVQGLSAKFIHCPLWWFESTTGKLRFLESEGSMLGIDMDPAGWMVTVGDGVMEPTSMAWLAKYWALKDWTLFSARHGMPWVKGVSTADKHTPEWSNIAEAVKDFADNMTTVVNAGDKLDVITTAPAGSPPYATLLDRMDRSIARLWLGSDLGTLSRQQAVGASLQAESASILAADDSVAIGETLTKTVSKIVLEYNFGQGVERLAYIKLKSDNQQDTENDIRIDEFLTKVGAPISQRSLLERYGRPTPQPGEPLILAAANPPPPAATQPTLTAPTPGVTPGGTPT